MNILQGIKIALEIRKLAGLIKEAYMFNLKDWKTTLGGLILGAAAFAKAYMANHGVTLAGFIEGLLPMLLGAYAKDPKKGA
jgi:hypothetical protein